MTEFGRVVPWIVAGALAGACAVQAYSHGSGARTAAATASLEPTAAPSALLDMRQRVARAIAEETPGLDSEPAVDAYLVQLERRARERGRVSALEVEPGVAAIHRLPPGAATNQKRDAFTVRMSRLSAELDAGVR